NSMVGLAPRIEVGRTARGPARRRKDALTQDVARADRGDEIGMPPLRLEPADVRDALQIDLAHDGVEHSAADRLQHPLALEEGLAGVLARAVARPEEEIVDERLASIREKQAAVLNEKRALDRRDRRDAAWITP